MVGVRIVAAVDFTDDLVRKLAVPEDLLTRHGNPGSTGQIVSKSPG